MNDAELTMFLYEIVDSVVKKHAHLLDSKDYDEFLQYLIDDIEPLKALNFVIPKFYLAGTLNSNRGDA